MPTYEYECQQCGVVIDHFAPMSDRPADIECKLCQGTASFIISKPMIQVDTIQDVPWLSDFAKKRKEARFGHKPIETRKEYKQYLKDKDLRPADGENLSEV